MIYKHGPFVLHDKVMLIDFDPGKWPDQGGSQHLILMFCLLKRLKINMMGRYR